jgi:(1->4)-alpha-D-glucan 1-alpha-D-glucosylmutase
MHIPSSTYRVQLNKDFTFAELQSIISYLHALGISTIYGAPVMKAAPGSTHGYDVTDPHDINPEIGTLDDLRSIAHTLHERKMSWLQDIVPNHMAFHPENDRLMDVLERGPQSNYYNYFDINWSHFSEELRGRLMIPILGKPLDECIRDKEISFIWNEKGLQVRYFDNAFPASLPVYQILSQQLHHAFDEFLVQADANCNLREWRDFKKDWMEKFSRKEEIQKVLQSVNESEEYLSQWLSKQFYVLRHWKCSDAEINYRRFFTVNSLICLRMEDPSVFDEYHTFILQLYEQGVFQGLRIDHIDGLQDPSAYTKRLRKLFGEECYLVAEKILEAKEEVPESWPLQGTSGYEFLSYVSQLFTDMKGARQLKAFYKHIVPDIPPYQQLVFENKKLILEKNMRGEWDNLVHYFIDLQLQGPFQRDDIRDALALIMLDLSVYRIYPSSVPLKGISLKVMNDAFEKALPLGRRDVLEYLRHLFTEKPATEDQGARIILFLKRLMQFTGPLTAKGVEDTTFYVYNPLISHDEVGDAPSTLGISIQAFHQKMQKRRVSTPLSLNATATHDTKRGEDARLRLNILSEMPDRWETLVVEWMEKNEEHHETIQGKPAPSCNDEYFIYQAMLGGFPEDLKVTSSWIERLEAYLVKAVREAKVNSSWDAPNEAYENACKAFVNKIVDHKSRFLDTFVPLVKDITRYAGVYALGQALIKITAPGIPDIYQGCELWDLSFVDPDNRRPVDYENRQRMLSQLTGYMQKPVDDLIDFLATERDKGMEKLFVVHKALSFRRDHHMLFESGEYIPLEIAGSAMGIAYARCHDNKWVIVAIPLGIVRESFLSFYEETFVILPPGAPQQWQSILLKDTLESNGNKISFSKLFKRFPVAFLYA